MNYAERIGGKWLLDGDESGDCDDNDGRQK